MSTTKIKFEKREADEKAERECADFLNRHFWKEIDEGFERVRDKERQQAGIDLIVGSRINIDEKVKNTGNYGTFTELPSVEILTTDNATHSYDCTGWFINPNSRTHLYAFYNVMGCTPTGEIAEVNVFLFKKSDLEDYLGEKCLSRIYDDARDLKHNGKMNHKGKITRMIDAENKPVWLSYSYKLKEKPVNLVTPMDLLRKLPNWWEYKVTTTGHESLGKKRHGQICGQQ